MVNDNALHSFSYSLICYLRTAQSPKSNHLSNMFIERKKTQLLCTEHKSTFEVKDRTSVHKIVQDAIKIIIMIKHNNHIFPCTQNQ